MTLRTERKFILGPLSFRYLHVRERLRAISADWRHYTLGASLKTMSPEVRLMRALDQTTNDPDKRAQLSELWAKDWVR
jgi:hypothetical protein